MKGDHWHACRHAAQAAAEQLRKLHPQWPVERVVWELVSLGYKEWFVRQYIAIAPRRGWNLYLQPLLRSPPANGRR